jgi:hypothetical protein
VEPLDCWRDREPLDCELVDWALAVVAVWDFSAAWDFWADWVCREDRFRWVRPLEDCDFDRELLWDVVLRPPEEGVAVGMVFSPRATGDPPE